MIFDFHSEYLIFFWLGLFVLFLVFEAQSYNLITLWFAIGAAATVVLALFVDGFIIQLFTFTAVSILLLFTARPSALRKLNKNPEKLNVEAAIGEIAVVVKKITHTNKGEVKHKHLIWMAEAEDKGTIDVDTEVEIVAIKGATYIVKKIN